MNIRHVLRKKNWVCLWVGCTKNLYDENDVFLPQKRFCKEHKKLWYNRYQIGFHKGMRGNCLYCTKPLNYWDHKHKSKYCSKECFKKYFWRENGSKINEKRRKVPLETKIDRVLFDVPHIPEYEYERLLVCQ